jgi:hypothetical protein
MDGRRELHLLPGRPLEGIAHHLHNSFLVSLALMRSRTVGHRRRAGQAVLTKRYGQLFLEALPECTVVRQRTDRLEELIF